MVSNLGKTIFRVLWAAGFSSLLDSVIYKRITFDIIVKFSDKILMKRLP